MDVQVQNAIEIAWNLSADQGLKDQAFEFLNQLRSNPSAWQICLSLFVRSPKLNEVVRHVSLEVVNNAIQAQQLSSQDLQLARVSLMDYVQQVYGMDGGQGDVDSPGIQNKLAQALTFLFEELYASGWESFFEDLRKLGGNHAASGSGSVGTLLYLRVLASVHDEIADVLVQNAAEKQKKHTELKDLIRVRDAAAICLSWQEILSRWREIDQVIVELCLKTISRWVSWTEISLIVNESFLESLWKIAEDQTSTKPDGSQSKVRDAAIDVFTEIIAKKMKPVEKIDLIRFLNLQAVVDQLVKSPSLLNSQGTSAYDTDMAETVAKLVNNAVLDIVKVLDTAAIEGQTQENAESLLQSFVPFLLRFFSDEYDEICSTVIPALNELLTLFRKIARQGRQMPSRYHAMLSPILDAIIAKMRYDDTSSWGEEDAETDEAEFQELRKRLKVLQQIVAAIDESLYLDSLSRLVESIMERFKSLDSRLTWRDLDLALHELYLVGELAYRNSGLYQKKVPSSVASERFIQLMSNMIESDIASFRHPAVHLQYMEICLRHASLFEHQTQYIPKVLENFVRFVHSDHIKVRARSWHLFLRFVKALRAPLGTVSETVVGAISDLLNIRAEVSEDSSNDDMSSNQNSQSADTLFASQLYLFEAIGVLASAPSVSADVQVRLAQATIAPLSSDIEKHVSLAISGDERAALQIHHSVMALGTVARGFSDWVPGTSGSPVLERVSDEFMRACEPILMALGSLKSSMTIRTAARFAFARMIGVLGFKVLQQLPSWIDGFLAENSTKDEMATFLRLLAQVIFGFKTQILDILDTLLTPLLQRIFASFAEPTTGTDDEIQLGELRREYLNFLIVLLSNNLESILVSPRNQAIFDTIVSTIEHFARDTSEHPDAKLATSVLTRMASVWGGPNITDPLDSTTSPAPSLPGFDQFMMTRFSALTWGVMTNPAFDPKDPQANRVVGEIATLQQTILAKTGRDYLTYLREVELRNLGLPGQAIDSYLTALISADPKRFKTFLLQFLQQSRGG